MPCGEDEEENEPVAFMAVRTTLPKPVAPSRKKDISFVISDEPVGMEWEFADTSTPPPGSDEKFKEGRLNGKTYLDVTMKQPDHYCACHKAKSLTVENRNYVNWAKKHFVIDAGTKEVTRASSKPFIA